jgi:transposase
MSRPFQIDIAESAADLKKQLQVAREGRHKEKLQMLWWLKSGQVCEHQEIGQRLGRDPSTVTRWLQTYRQGGLVALLAVHKAPGAQRKLSAEVLAALQKELETGPGFSSYGAIVQWLEREQGQRIEYGTVYHWVRYRLGAKLKVPRPQSYQQDPTVVEGFKEKLGAMLVSLETLLAQGHRIRYLCQDETRLGLKTLTGKVITAQGVKPTVPVQWGRENFWIYGAIEPLSGEYFMQEYPQLNGAYFQEFLDGLSQYLAGDYAILQVDQAGAHLSSAIRWPENIIPLAQPPHAPELNPIERLWQWLKQPLQNQLFPSLQALRERIQAVWDNLTQEQVRSLSAYDFILEALFYAASY